MICEWLLSVENFALEMKEITSVHLNYRDYELKYLHFTLPRYNKEQFHHYKENFHLFSRAWSSGGERSIVSVP